MNPKRSLWPWLVVGALLLGMVLAMFEPVFGWWWYSGDFAWSAILWRFYLYAPLCFIALGVALFPVKLARWLFSWRTFRWMLRAVTVLVLLAVLFYMEEDWRCKHAWDKYRREQEAKGEKFDLASFVPPPIPDAQNFALTSIVASSYLRYLDKSGHRLKPENTNVVNRLHMPTGVREDEWLGNTNTLGDWRKCGKINLPGWQKYFRTPLDTNDYYREAKDFPISPNPQTPAADVLLALSKYDSALEELRQVAEQCPQSRFPLNYQDMPPMAWILPHLSALENCANVLRVRAVAELASHHNEKALADIKLLVHLADSIRNEPGFWSQLSRLKLLSDMIQPIWEGVSGHQWSEIELAELDRCLGTINLLAEYPSALRGDRTRNLAAIEFMRCNRSRIFNCFPMITHLSEDNSYEPPNDIDAPVPFEDSLFAHMIPSGWFYASELTMSRIHQSALPAATDSGVELVSVAAYRAETQQEYEHKHITPYNVFALAVCPLYEIVAERYVQIQSSLDLARVACALERYRLAQGGYPESLGTLAPDFIAAVPADVVNGQPLHYRRTVEGHFVLYSVGWNETDDGGTVGLTEGGGVDYRKGDLVWQN